MGIFDITYSLQVSRLLPPNLRSLNITNAVNSLVSPLQYLSDKSIKFGRIGYVEPTVSTPTTLTLQPNITMWSNVTAYSKGDKVYMPFSAVYIATENNTGQQPDISASWDRFTDDLFGFETSLLISGQTASLEYILNIWCYGTYNGALTPTPRNTIYIVNNTTSNQVFHIGLTTEASSKIFLSNPDEYIGLTGTANTPQYDFTVNVPTGFALLTQLTAIVNKYKLVGTTYNINYY
jgi:hypothetical protein